MNKIYDFFRKARYSLSAAELLTRDAFQIRQASDYIIETEISVTKVVEIIEWGKTFLADAENFLK